MITIIGSGRLGKLIEKQLTTIDYQTTNTTGLGGALKFDINFDNLDVIPDSQSYIFSIPPSKINLEACFRNLELIKEKRIIFVSSTSVYGKQEGMLNEDSLVKTSNSNTQKLIAIEERLLSYKKATIVRPAGLYSHSSHPGQFLSGKKDIKAPNSPINLVSREDVASAILKILNQTDYRIINVVNTHHPLKSAYYNQYCTKMKLEPIVFDSLSSSPNKVICSKFPEFHFSSSLP